MDLIVPKFKKMAIPIKAITFMIQLFIKVLESLLINSSPLSFPDCYEKVMMFMIVYEYFDKND